MADKTKLKSLKDLHSAIADLAAHYIPKDELVDYFRHEALENVQSKPSYNISEDQRGVIETMLLGLLEKKNKTVQEKGRDKEVQATAVESLVIAAKESIPSLLNNDEDNYQNLVHLHPEKIRRFVAGVKDAVLDYFSNNKKRLQNQDLDVDGAISAVSILDRGLENKVIGACKKEIRHLESELRAEARDAGQAWRYAATLERKNDLLERKAVRLKTKKEELEQAVAQLTERQETPAETQAEPQAEAVQAPSEDYRALEQENQNLRQRLQTVAARLRSRIESNNQEKERLQAELNEKDALYAPEIVRLNQEIAGLRAEYDVDFNELVETVGKLNMFESQNKNLEIDLEQAIQYKQAEIKDLQEQVLDAEHKYEQEKSAKELYEAAFTALNERYQARFVELGSMVAEWYAFTEQAMQGRELSGNEQLKDLRSRNKKLAGLVSDLIEEAKSGSRVGQGRKSIKAPWNSQGEDSLPALCTGAVLENEPVLDNEPALENEEKRYEKLIADVKAEHQREIWGWMHALQTSKAPYDIQQKAYEAFLKTDPKDNMIKCVVHNNLGTIFYLQKSDYESARMHYQKAVDFAKQEFESNSACADAAKKLKEARDNLGMCSENLVA